MGKRTAVWIGHACECKDEEREGTKSVKCVPKSVKLGQLKWSFLASKNTEGIEF